ncbi:MAG: aspartate aminotransferase family protein [Actinobacteria bacterium]|nr:aspartate aminotransferase family protein [Actinomycetota bacterium]
MSDLAIPANADERAAALADFSTYLNPQKVRVMRTAGLDLVEGERSGAWVWDVDGRRFLDCFTSAGSVNVGRRHPKVVAAAKEALDHLDHGNFLLCSAQKARLAERLAELSPGDLTCTTFGTGGGEAIDFSLKLARGATGRPRIVSTVNGYHGHTGFALSAGGREAFREPFEPLIPEFAFVPFGDANALRDAVDERTAAVILEPIQGEGGIVVPPDGYLTVAREACDSVGAKLIFDEIQTGMGRTGRWFASQHEGVVPDVMTVAKSLGGSLAAISATIYTEEMREFLIPHPFIHLSTFGGSDLACAIALATLEVIEEEGLVENAAAMGDRLLGGLTELAVRHPDMIAETRGRGLMTGVKYREDSHGPRMSYQLSQRGVLAIYSGNEPSVMRLMPSLVVGPDEIDLLLTALDESINAVRAGDGPADEVTTRVRRRPQRAAQEG